MEFWLGLDKEEQQRRAARQRLLRRVFWSLGILVVVVQVVLILIPSDETEVATADAAQDRDPAPFIISGPARAVRTTIPSPVVATPTATQTQAAMPTATQTQTQTPTATQTQTVPLTGRTAPNGSATPFELTHVPQRVSELSFSLAGRGQPGETISVIYRQAQIAQTAVDAAGNWRVDVPTGPLERGKNALQAESSANGKPRAFAVEFAPWWLDAPVRLQGVLGEGFACAPTVLSMAFDYYHALNASYPAPATTQIVAALERQGFISGYGADAQMLANLAISYGYSHSAFYHSWTQAHLRRMLDDGVPVIANVRVNMSTEGYGHSVLVIGLSPDGERVMVNDPAHGMVAYAWATFDRSWGSFGPPYRHGTVVKP